MPHATECWYCGTEFESQDIADVYCSPDCQDLAADMDEGMVWEPDFQTRDEEMYEPIQF